MGPVATRQQLEKDEGMVRRAVSEGAEIVYGGRRANPESLPNGYFYSPTILTGGTPDSFIAQNEVFGPVLSVIPFDDEEEAIAIANGTPYGLAAYFYTESLKRAWRVGEALEFGMVGLNTGLISTEVAPFGGVKQSGLGREGSQLGIDEYLEAKTFHIGGLG